MSDLPALTYTIHHATDRLRRQHEYYQQEIFKTRALMMGDQEADPNLSANYGIVSATDPTTHLTGGTDPLAVSVNAQSQFTLDVNPGTAIMESGCWIELHDAVRQIGLAESAVGTPNVIYLQYLLDSAPDEPNMFHDMVSPYTVRVGDVLNNGVTPSTQSVLLGVLTADTYIQLADSVKQNLVPLAVAMVQTVDTGGGVLENQLTVDHTVVSYSFNRPWFSVIDTFHRSQIGTGTVTSTNPHALSGNDWTIGDLSALQIHLDHGMILAKDRSVARVPGYRCTTIITNILTDDASGTLTGYASAAYIELPYFPINVGRCWYTTNLDAIAAVLVPQTNRVVFPYVTPTTGIPLGIHYTRAEAGEPPLPGNTVFRTNGPTTQELAIAGGVGLVSLTTTEEAFSDAYQVPMRYEIFMDADGALRKTPQVVYCYKRLDDLGTSDTANDITPYGSGRVMMALIGADDVFALDVQIRVYGTDTAGATIDELFTFTSATWDPVPVIPAMPDPAATFLHFSTAVFATITNITVEARANDGSNSAIMLWMAQHAYSNYDLQADALHLATVDWNGYSLGRVFDKRIVGTTVRDELVSATDSGLREMIYNLLAGGNATVWVEDFLRPRYHSLETPDELDQNAAHYPTFNFSKQRMGLHGYYQSIAFPIHPDSGTVWRVSLFGAQGLVDPWFPNQPIVLAAYGGGWLTPTTLVIPVPGMPGTWETTTPYTPNKMAVQLYPGQCTGMAIYG